MCLGGEAVLFLGDVYIIFRSFCEMTVPPLIDHIRDILWSFKNKWEFMRKTFRWSTSMRMHVHVSTMLAILGMISLPRFPELSWAGVLALSVSDSNSCYSLIPASQEPVFQLPDKWPLLPPTHLNFPRKENLFQNTCRECWFLSPANPLTML